MSTRPATRPAAGPPSPSSPSYYSPQDQEFGGYAFPQAQVSSAQPYSYAPQPQPQQAPQPYGSYGPSTYPAPSPPPPTQYGAYPTGPNSYPHNNPAGSSYNSGYPPPPPQHPLGTDPSHSSDAPRPSGGSGIFPSNVSSILNAGRIQSLAQTGMATGTKLLNKFKK